jgi:peptidyl-prolyl cis-trans isomerase D
MAVIGKIRSKSGLLFGVVGAAMVLFILGDLLNSGGGILRNQNNVGEIWGQSISYAEFDALVEQRIGANQVNEAQREQIRDQVWNALLQERILFKEYEKLGIGTTPEEILFEIKNNPRNEVLNQYFTNPRTGNIFDQFVDQRTGGLSNSAVLGYLQNLINSGQDENWAPIEEALIANRRAHKYNNLIKFGLGVTNSEVLASHIEQNRTLRFTYAMKEYASIPNEDISYDDGDLRSYYNDHKDESEYQQEETSRSIAYVSFPVTPTSDDYEAIKTELGSLVNAFYQAESDTSFVNDFSDYPFNFAMYGEDDLPEGIDSVVFGSELGDVFGPYEWKGQLHISKLTNKLVTADSVRASHILLTWSEGGDSNSVRTRIDSIKTAIEGGANFEKLAEDLSEDFGSAAKGGDLDWFGRGRMVPPFEKAAFETDKDDMVVVETQYGMHLILITDRSADREKVILGSVTRDIVPSEATYEQVFNQASEFSITNDSYEKMKAAVEANANWELEELDFIKEADKTLGTFESPRRMIRWVYESEKGDVSEVYEESRRFVIAAVTAIKNEGALDFENVRDQIEQKVINEKKAGLIIEQLGEVTSLNAAAGTMGVDVQSVDALSFGEFSIPGIGRENELFGLVFSLDPGELAGPVVGERGVFVVQADVFTEPVQDPDYVNAKDQMRRDLSERVDFEAFAALQDAVEVVDNRYQFY